MAKKTPWIPREHEAQLFHELYMDESSQNGRHRFFVFGGIILPMTYSDLFEAAMIEARPPRLKRIRSNGLLPEIAWKFVSNGDFEDYKAVVDAYYAFRTTMRATTLDAYRFQCSVLDTTIEGRRYSGGIEGEDRFNREIFFLAERVARDNPKLLFHVYPAKRSTIRPVSHLAELGTMINGRLHTRGDTRDWPIRRLDFRENESSQALQISDIFIGALAFRINRHYDKPNANNDKKRLADYILQRGRYLLQINKGKLKDQTWGEYQVYIRRHGEWGPATLDRHFRSRVEPDVT
jgi:hypothetical protein